MINALAGLPRSGSTLLANVLAQHPDIYVSGTSSLSNVLDAAQGVLSNDPTVISELSSTPEMYAKYQSALRGLAEGWYSDRQESCIIDKGRTWSPLWTLQKDLWPEANTLFTVRDPRDVIASIERQHRATGVFRSTLTHSLRDSAEQLMSQTGLVGSQIKFAEDLIRRKAEGVTFIRYESFVFNPQTTLNQILEAFKLDSFEFDIMNVESRGGDADEVWRGKYPHRGVGTIKPSEGSWNEFLDDGLANDIAGVYPMFMQTFAYS